MCPFGFFIYHYKLHCQIWEGHALKFYGCPHLGSQFVAFFTEFIVDFNIVYENIMMKMFLFSMKGKSA
jgi:hypothetical protein